MWFLGRIDSARRAIGKVLIQHPWIMCTGLAASHLCLAAAAELNLREKEDGHFPCTKRTIAFEGFGALATRQCDPMIEVYQLITDAANATILTVVGLAYFELSKIRNLGGSDTLAQVPLECLQNKLSPIVNKVIEMAQFDNPPLNPFPSGYSGICKVTVERMNSVSRNSNHHSVSVHPARDINFFFQNLSSTVCAEIFDFINSEARDCQDRQRAAQLDAGKAFLVMGLIAGAAVVVVGGAYCVFRLTDRASEYNRNQLFQLTLPARMAVLHLHEPEPAGNNNAAVSAC